MKTTKLLYVLVFSVICTTFGNKAFGQINQLSFTQRDALDDELIAFIGAVRRREVPAVTGQMGREALKIALNIMDQIHSSTHRFSGS